MATPTLVSPEEYLQTSFDGLDREYVDGEILERTMPPYIHGRIQMRLGFLFGTLALRFPVVAVSEVRHGIKPGLLYRIPDVAVFADGEPSQPVPLTPPLVAIEILSPEDRMGQVLQKFNEYLNWGVPHIWLIDPEFKRFHIYDSTGLHPVASLALPQYDFTITLADLDLQ